MLLRLTFSTEARLLIFGLNGTLFEITANSCFNLRAVDTFMPAYCGMSDSIVTLTICRS